MIETDIESLGYDLYPGETGRYVCPSCKASHESSLAITRMSDGGLAYMCHRASCGLKGFVGGLRLPPEKMATPSPKSSHKPFKKVLEPLPHHVIQFIEDKYGIDWKTLLEYEVEWCREEQAIAMPIKKFGLRVGITLKTIFQEKKVVKTYRFPNASPQELMGWHRFLDDPFVFIVEDQLSAMKLAQCGANAISLCGTHFNDARAREIMSYFESLVFWLDLDAANKAIDYVIEYGPLFTWGAYCTVTGQDPKDCPKEIINERIQYYSRLIEQQKSLAANKTIPSRVLNFCLDSTHTERD